MSKTEDKPKEETLPPSGEGSGSTPCSVFKGRSVRTNKQRAGRTQPTTTNNKRNKTMKPSDYHIGFNAAADDYENRELKIKAKIV